MKDFFTLRNGFLALGFCSVLGLSAQGPTVIEAEDYIDDHEVDLKSFTKEGTLVSGGAGLGLDRAHKGSYATYYFDAPEAGTYNLTIYYLTMNTRWLSIQVNDQMANIVKFDRFTGTWDGLPGEVEDEDGNKVMRPGLETKTIQIYCEEGANYIKVSAIFGYSPEEGRDIKYAPTLDRFEITRADSEIEKPADWNVDIDRIKVQCEDYDGVTGAGQKTNRPPFEGGVGAKVTQEGGTLSYNINVPEEGAYMFEIWYVTMQRRWMTLKVNSQEPSYLSFLDFTDGWGDKADEQLARRQMLIYLEKGDNVITLGQYTKTGKDASEHGDSPSVDYFTIDRVNYPDLVRPENEIVMYKASLADIAKWSGTLDVTAIRDHNEYTVATDNSTTGQVVLEFPVNIYLVGYAFATSNNADKWTVETSVDGQNWSPVTISSNGTVSGVTTCGVLRESDSAPVKYVRLNMSGDQPVSLGDFAVFGNIEQHFANALLVPDAVAYDASHNGFDDGGFHEGINKLFDGDFNSKYTVRSVDLGGKSDIEIVIYLDNETAVKSYSMSTHFPTSYVSRAPKEWTLEAFDWTAFDGEGGYVTVDSREGMDFRFEGSTLAFDVTAPVASDMYRLTLKNRSGQDTHLSDLQLYGEALGEKTGISNVFDNASVTAIWGESGCVAISADSAARYNVFNLSGISVAAGACVEGVTRVNLPAGLYIVTVNGRAAKVVVK